jgi:hypothetical protein
MERPRADTSRHLISLLLAAVLLPGCDALPRDSNGALQRARGGELRVGVVENPPWVRFESDSISGLEVELIEAWAKGLGARVIWRRGPEADLVDALHRREIDVLVAGFDSRTPYGSKLAPTQPYLEIEDRFGSKKKHIMAVTQGESALLFALDQFLASQDKAALRRRAQEMQQQIVRP